MQIKSIVHNLMMLFWIDYQCTTQKRYSNPFVVVLDAGHGGKDPGRPTNLMVTKKKTLPWTLF